MTNRHIALPLYLSLLAFAACGRDYVCRHNESIDDEQWAYEDSLRFAFHIEDTARIYELSLTVVHSPDYSFQNLYVRIHTQFPDGHRLSEQVSLELADKAGQWLGRCRGESCRLQIPIQPRAYFEQAGPYNIIIEQYMRQSPLPGVRGFQLAIKDTREIRK
jgi:gliding motility-associated lipoprotein GldH